MSDSILVRPLTTLEEMRTQVYMADRAFSSEPSEESARRWLTYLTAAPDFYPEMMRGAFADGQQAGGYLFLKRTLRMGAARIPAGCLGAVVTSPEYRKRGVARALMQDAIEFANANRLPLLLLDGIPNFYYRFGYIDIYDTTMLRVERGSLRQWADSLSGYTTRQATAEDAATVYTLYQQHYAGYTGSFDFSLEIFQHRFSPQKYLLAIRPDGQVAGYATSPEKQPERITEIAAETPEALLALLQEQDRRSAQVTEPLTCLLPQRSLMADWLIQLLRATGPHKELAANEWSVQTQINHQRFAGWMGRLNSLAGFLHAILPELQARWERSLAHWNGSITLIIEQESCTLHCAGRSVELSDTAAQAPALQFTPQLFLQLAFGYRSLQHVLSETGQRLPFEAQQALSILFPPDHTFIPASDWF
ncbi:acetyltransferase (GNAT) family protein [Thermosporothrix hazakensis]|jgi:predicted N-acetyltransferase YhbS|uniref:Acetyltransferase (GNAT) family protein n=1 Tax=Thermosporothrix hazakensis TaxID=644383 RepID=A0A326UDM3_THEHA|nr:GNAT family N-acetyltransferase [Thermosporothrix hazakensis]PZW27506.1 acetyltransferase (GNAT) family protein [Thermosporothrix hazakensis]GCE45672.1 hypothetical protein KTH_05410 [Thermosporothrix hazakensis]